VFIHEICGQRFLFENVPSVWFLGKVVDAGLRRHDDGGWPAGYGYFSGTQLNMVKNFCDFLPAMFQRRAT